MLKQICIMALLIGLFFSFCGKEENSFKNGPVAINSLPASTMPETSKVQISVYRQEKKSILLKLENKTDSQVFVAYQLSEEKGKARFLSNYLERKVSGKDEFKTVEPVPHFGPRLYPIKPGESIIFAPFFVPEEAGEYRVHVRYIDDELVYKLLLNKIPFEMTGKEKEQVENAWKSVYSDIFIIGES